jgi:hypothetical protein
MQQPEMSTLTPAELAKEQFNDIYKSDENLEFPVDP